MEKITKFLTPYKWYFIGALVLLAVVSAYFIFKFKKEISDTMKYITTNSEAASWKKNIQDKATTSNRTFDEQLYLEAKYMLSQKYKGNPFLYLV